MIDNIFHLDYRTESAQKQGHSSLKLSHVVRESTVENTHVSLKIRSFSSWSHGSFSEFLRRFNRLSRNVPARIYNK